MKKVLFILLMCFLFITVLSAQNITVVHPSTEFIKVETDAVKGIVQQNTQELKLANNTVKIYYTKEPEEFVVVRLSNSTYFVSFALIKTNGNNFEISNNDYIPKVSDFELYQKNKDLLKTTTTNDDFLFDTKEGGIPTAVSAINTATAYASLQKYNTSKKIGTDASVENIQNAIINNDLIGMGNVGHGNPSGIQLSNGYLNYTWFASQDLSGTVFYFNSCYTFNEPLKSSILNDGNARTFIGGNDGLPQGSSEEVFKDFWSSTLNHGVEMGEALRQAETWNGLLGYHGMGGDEGIMNLTTNGSLRGNEIWSGNITITGNVTVPSGKTLEIKAGSNITFQNNSRLIVSGTLNVNGTSNSKVTFNFNSGSYGVWLNDYSHADINHAIITGGTYGIRSSKADLKIINSEVYGINHGLYLLNHNSTTYEAEIFDNDIRGGFNYGIYLYNSDGKIRNNLIRGGERGIYCNNGSSPHLGEPGYFGLNEIQGTYGVRSYNSSNPFLGKYNCTDQGGLNSFTNSSSYFIYASNNCNIDAENNWFGTDPPISTKIYASSGSSIDYDPWHHSPPSGALAKTSSSKEETVFDEQFSETTLNNISDKKYHYDPNWSIRWKLLYVRNLIFVDDFKFAQDICKSILDEYPDSTLSYYALDLLRQASRFDTDNFTSYLTEKTLLKDKKELYGKMELMLAGFETAKSTKVLSIDNTAKKYEGTFIEEVALFQKFMYYFNDEEDEKTARSVSDELDKKYPKSESAYEAHILLGDEVKETDKELEPKNTLNKTTNVLPEEYALLGNYPNPFNPSTTIKYALPFNSNIKFTIYDLSGKEIKNFIINSQSSGYNNVVWDGTNNNGTQVTSGVYIYKFKAVSLEGNGEVFEKSAKLMLVK